MREKASALKPIVDQLENEERDGFRENHSLVKQGDCRSWKKRAVSCQGIFCRKNVNKRLRINSRGFSRDVVSETVVVETLREHFRRTEFTALLML